MIYREPHMLPLGSDLPDFWLPDTDGVIVPKDHLMGAPAILVIFMNNSSPFVKHIRQVMVKIVWEYQQRGTAAVAINSSDTESQPDDCPSRMKEDASTHGYTFPYLFDATQEVARLFRASHVPDFFLYDKWGKLTYHGRMDESSPVNGLAVTGRDLRDALNAVLLEQPISRVQMPGLGTGLTWRGQEAMEPPTVAPGGSGDLTEVRDLL